MQPNWICSRLRREELKARTNVFSFDRAKFEARIVTGEPWQQLLQAHLYFDHVITRMLTDALKNPTAINLRVNTGLSTPHVFPVRVFYFVSRPTWRVALCSARKGASLSRNHSAGDRENYPTKRNA